ncbi:MAG TPA: hypothetical protein VIX73_04030 [Kofleriaceae bacterium]
MRWILLVLLAVAACRGDAQQCDQGCRNMASLVFWRDADKEIAAAPADQRDALRKQKLAELTTKLEAGIDFCVSQCQAAGNQRTIDCLIAAKTADQAVACTK